MRIGISGFGRIGRTVARVCGKYENIELVAINDIIPDAENLRYLWNYDSTYGKLHPKVTIAANGRDLTWRNQTTKVFNERNISNVPWNDLGVDVIIDASGVNENVAFARDIRTDNAAKVIVTHSPNSGIDRYVVMGVNEDQILPSDQVLSSSICDVNAIAHPIQAITQEFGIASGNITTLHPWLGYQNLVDAALSAQSTPGHYWKDYSLGRASVGALIPKSTTAIPALSKIIPDATEKLSGFSYRTPTSIVTSADMSLCLETEVSRDTVAAFLAEYFAASPYVSINTESLTSCDYTQDSSSVIIDAQWTSVTQNNLLRLITWYDNEWGYASRVVDLCHHLKNMQETKK